MTVEVRTRLGWRAVRHGLPAPQVEEAFRLELRGAPGAELWFGASRVTLDHSGAGSFRLAEDQALNGHLGYMPVLDGNGLTVGEIEVIPSKISQPAYEALRADLVRVWGDLIFDPDGVSGLSARPPSAAELLKRIERPLLQIIDRPAERLTTATGVRRLDRVRYPREMRPAVVLAGMRGAPALTRVLERSIDTPERQLVVATLHRLLQHAWRDPHGATTARRIEQVLTGPLAGVPVTPIRAFTWGMRTDPRYRQVLAVYRILDQPYLRATEGPGELRLGIRGMIRLYEYWVYLQVLLAARSLYGAPLGAGFDVLAVEQLGGRTRRLELPAGTTIRFPGDVHIAFEPEIKSNGSGWMNIEYVPHPDHRRQQLKATPDVAVLHGRDNPRLTVIDAKYVGRVHVERESAALHEKYARMRLRGRPIVDAVYAAHPHADFKAFWAGYGHFGLAPTQATVIPLPRVGRRAGDVRLEVPVEPTSPATTSTDDLTIIADQFWMLRHLAGRRVSLSDLRRVVSSGRTVRKATIVMPNITALHGFALASQRDGWEVQWASDVDRDAQLDDLAELVGREILVSRVIVVSGDQELLERLPSLLVEVCSDLSGVSSLPASNGPLGGLAAQSPITPFESKPIETRPRSARTTSELFDTVNSIVSRLTIATPLEAIALDVQRALGLWVAEDWGGFGKFKPLLQAVRPDLQIVDFGPGYAVPPGVTWVEPVRATGAPPTVRHAADGEVPRELVEGELENLVRRLVARLDRPTALVALAAEVQRELGPQVAESWGGFGRFKSLLLASCPYVEIDDRAPGYVVPPGTNWSDASSVFIRDGGTLPSIVNFLLSLDTSVPNVTGVAMQELMAGVALALNEGVWSRLAIFEHEFLGIRAVNELTLYVRDTFAAQQRVVARRHLNHLLKSLLFAGKLQPRLSLSEAQSALAESLIRIADRKGFAVAESDILAVREWLAGV